MQFVRAVMGRWPKAVLQFEVLALSCSCTAVSQQTVCQPWAWAALPLFTCDCAPQDFNMSHAQPLLDRYRYHHSTFNDDIQGTAATALAGLYGAMKVLPLLCMRMRLDS